MYCIRTFYYRYTPSGHNWASTPPTRSGQHHHKDTLGGPSSSKKVPEAPLWHRELDKQDNND